MKGNVLSTTLFASLFLAPFIAPASAQQYAGHPTPTAAMACCAGHDHAAMPCCTSHDHGVAPAPAEVVPQTPAIPETPAVQAFFVTFRDPVRVGDRILLGRYIIQHDNHRMARGEACTYIYEASDPRLPVVVFHCTHLTRPAPAGDTVFLRRSSTYPLQELREFQFAGESASHGVPIIR